MWKFEGTNKYILSEASEDKTSYQAFSPITTTTSNAVILGKLKYLQNRYLTGKNISKSDEDELIKAFKAINNVFVKMESENA